MGSSTHGDAQRLESPQAMRSRREMLERRRRRLEREDAERKRKLERKPGKENHR